MVSVKEIRKKVGREVRDNTIKRLLSKLDKNMEILDIEKSVNGNASDYKVKLLDKNTGISEIRNYSSIIYRKNKLSSFTNKKNEVKEIDLNNAKISDLLSLNKGKYKKVKNENIINDFDVIQLKINRETRKLLENKSSGDINSLCNDIISEYVSENKNSKDDKYDTLVSMIAELTEKISKLSVNVSFSK